MRLGWIAGERGRVITNVNTKNLVTKVFTRTPLINSEIPLPSDFAGSASRPIPASLSGVRRGSLQSIHRTIDARDNSGWQNDVLPLCVCRTTRALRRI
jgi:hypothetical protein